MDILIAGAGLGGLCAALKLHRLGMRVKIAESARELRPLGVGINLLPHGAAVLYELGLGKQLEATGVQTRAVEYRTQWGQLILRDPRGKHAGMPWPHFSIHRGELHRILLEAVLAELPGGSLLTDHRAEGFAPRRGGGIELRTRRGTDGAEVPLHANVLIGADGIHSAICRQLHPNHSDLVFSGTMMWRGAVECDPYLDGETMVVAGHHDNKAVIYPISRAALDRGRSLVNMTGEIHIGKQAAYPKEDWNRPASVNEFIHAFEDWKFDWMDVPATFRATKDIFVYPMVDRDPLPDWGHDAVALLGDAAHPMYPIGANGASQAFLDADALGKAFAETAGRDPVEALRLYEERRLPVTAKVVASNRAKGPEAVLQLARERVKGPQDDVQKLISKEELDAITLGYQKVAGFDAATLQNRIKSGS